MTKKNDNKDAFNLEEALNNVEMPKMFVRGLEAYITNRNLEPKSEKEFEKILKEFGELKL